MSRPAPQGILRAIGTGRVPLTHEGLNTLTPRRSVIYIRDLMVAVGILPPVDRFLFLFEQWWPTWLATIEDPEHRKVLRHFITWHVLRTMRATIASRGELGHGPPSGPAGCSAPRRPSSRTSHGTTASWEPAGKPTSTASSRTRSTRWPGTCGRSCAGR